MLLGPGSDAQIAGHFGHLKHHLNDHPDVHLELRFDHELAHLVYAGADLVVMPSMFEPCGLVQQVAVKYGTVPVARAIGGVMDTVFDHHYSSAPPEQRNGFVFEHVDHAALESAMARAIRLWQEHPDQFRQLMLNGMRTDRSWAQPARDYLNVYDYVRHKDATARQPELDSVAAPRHDRWGSPERVPKALAAQSLRRGEQVCPIDVSLHPAPLWPGRLALEVGLKSREPRK